jgi:hypothetical protein
MTRRLAQRGLAVAEGSIYPVLAFAATQGYATDGGTILADAAVGAACFGACAALVRWWVVKRPQRFSASFENAS